MARPIKQMYSEAEQHSARCGQSDTSERFALQTARHLAKQHAYCARFEFARAYLLQILRGEITSRRHLPEVNALNVPVR